MVSPTRSMPRSCTKGRHVPEPRRSGFGPTALLAAGIAATSALASVREDQRACQFGYWKTFKQGSQWCGVSCYPPSGRSFDPTQGRAD